MTERQGLLSGDLNIVQRAGLQWLMNQEITELVEIEKMRIENFALASNQATSPGYLKQLFAVREKEEREARMEEADNLREELEEEEDIWLTPNSIDDLESMLVELSGQKE